MDSCGLLWINEHRQCHYIAEHLQYMDIYIYMWMNDDERTFNCVKPEWMNEP